MKKSFADLCIELISDRDRYQQLYLKSEKEKEALARRLKTVPSEELIGRLERASQIIGDVITVNRAYARALEFYSDRKSWCEGDNSPIELDQGWVARQALLLKEAKTRGEYQKMMVEFEKNFREKGWDM